MKIIILTLLVALMSIWAADAADVKLAWDANIEPEVIGYKMHWSLTNTIPFTNDADVGNLTTYTVTGLVENQTYFFAVTAYSATRESKYSDIIEYVVNADRIIIRIIDRPKDIRIEW